MPISQKIKDQINELDAKKEEKELLLKMLEYEDQGLGWYKNTYSKEIKAFIEKMERED